MHLKIHVLLYLALKESPTVDDNSFHVGCFNVLLLVAGIAPYMALELALFDLMPKDVAPFVRGFSSALFATTLCYPLDTVR